MTHHEVTNDHGESDGKRPDADMVSGEEETSRPRVRVTDRRHSARPADEDAAPHGGADDAAGATPPEQLEQPLEAPDGSGEPDELALAKQEAAEYREHLLRLQAEFDNFRKRTMREQTDSLERASEPLLRRLLEVLDEFDLALMAADRTPDLEQFLRGVELVYAKLTDILEAEGLQRIEAVGRPFDPELHEALMNSEEGGDGELVVGDVFRQGYTLKGRVIRPAGVRVGRS